MKRFLERLNIDFGKFNLTDEDFKIDSDIHGIGHVYRVMFNTLLLGNQLDDVKNTKNSFYAAFIHDLSRRHDGHCELHGGFSVDENFDKYKHLFVDGNFDDIKMASICEPPLTTISQPTFEIGQMAMDLLLNILNKGIIKNRNYILEHKLIIRESCGYKEVKLPTKS